MSFSYRCFETLGTSIPDVQSAVEGLLGLGGPAAVGRSSKQQVAVDKMTATASARTTSKVHMDHDSLSSEELSNGDESELGKEASDEDISDIEELEGMIVL